MTKNKIIIGSRESALAVLQSEMVKSFLNKEHPELHTEILTMKTTGDKILDRTLDKIGGKGLFVKELDLALIEKRSDISVHSLKDMPMEVPSELPLLAFSKREDPRDVLVLPKGADHLDKSKPLGCSSLRRTLQLKELYPDMEVKSIRGNLQTRLRKLDEGEYAVVSLWAMDRMVMLFSFFSCSISFCIKRSEVLSRAEVASSKIRISGFRKKIRAMAIRCL